MLKLVSLQYGLIGSTEWGEDFSEWIKDHVVAYVNIGMQDLQNVIVYLTLDFIFRYFRIWIPSQGRRISSTCSSPP